MKSILVQAIAMESKRIAFWKCIAYASIILHILRSIWMSGQANYAILQQVAKEEGFEFNTLYDMFQIESSGRPEL